MSIFNKHHEHDIHTHDHINNHNHDHQHSPSERHNHFHNTSKLKIVLSITLIYAFVEIIAAIFTKSLALGTDAVHMLTDAFALFIAVYMAKLSQKPANNNYSYGHGRADTIGALMNALFMLLIIAFIVYEGVSRFIHPVEVNGLSVTVVASFGLIINIFSLKLLHGGDSLNTKAAFVHVLGDMLGSVSAIIAGIIIYYTGFMQIDAILSILVSLLILVPTVKILLSSVKILMESVPDHISYIKVGEDILDIEHVISVHDLHIWTMNSSDTSLSAHVLISNITEWDSTLINIQKMLLEKYNIHHITLQPECSELSHNKNGSLVL